MGSMVEHCSMNSNNWNGNGFGLDGMAMAFNGFNHCIGQTIHWSRTITRMRFRYIFGLYNVSQENHSGVIDYGYSLTTFGSSNFLTHEH